MTFLDVGQGDAIVLETVDGHAMLVDAGPAETTNGRTWNAGERTVVPYLEFRRIRRLDVLALTHPHQDHVGGMTAVLAAYKPGLVLDPGIPFPSPEYTEFLKAVRKAHCRYLRASEGLKVELGQHVAVSVLSPPAGKAEDSSVDVNDRSLILLVTCGDVSFLLTGDAGADAEARLVERLGHVTLLKVAHHGSARSTSETFLEACRPRAAVISVGRNNHFGHPSREVLQRLAAAGARVFRTDLHGAVTAATDGRQLRLQTMLAAPTAPRRLDAQGGTGTSADAASRANDAVGP
ncbi:MAG: ComEC/Rec2 family competence protein [Armatimonadota bacterium]